MRTLPMASILISSTASTGNAAVITRLWSRCSISTAGDHDAAGPKRMRPQSKEARPGLIPSQQQRDRTHLVDDNQRVQGHQQGQCRLRASFSDLAVAQLPAL